MFLFWSPWKPHYLHKPRMPHAVHALLYPWDTQDFLNIFSPRREALQWAAVPESLVGQRAWTFPGRAGRTKGPGLCTVHKYNYGVVPANRQKCTRLKLQWVEAEGSVALCFCRAVKFGTLLWAPVKHFLNHIRIHGDWPASNRPSMCLLLVLVFYRVGSHCFS